MTLIATPYTTRAAIERFLSSSGVTAFCDHDEDSDPDDDVLDDAINEATEEINFWLHDRYEEASLAASTIVVRWATWLAAWFLCHRRGNPAPESLTTEIERLRDPDAGMLARIQRGQMQLPNVAMKYDFRPSWSNLKVDRRWPSSKTRVTRVNSSDAPTKLSQDNYREAPVYDG